MPNADRQKQERALYECFLFYYNEGDCINVLQATTADKPVTLQIEVDGERESVVFSPMYLSRGQIQRGADETPDQMPVSTNFDSEYVAEFIASSVSETLTCKLYQVYASEDQALYTSDDYIVAFWGESTSVDRRDNAVSVVFQGFNARFQETIPRVLTFKSCPYRLYDGFTCRAIKENYTWPGQIQYINPNRREIAVVMDPASPTFVAGAFEGGIINFGDEICKRASINRDVVINGQNILRAFTLLTKLPEAVQVGQQVEVSYGCDRTKDGDNGCKKFNNRANFGGSPYIQIRNIATDRL
jgi:hypothetical protein